MGQERDIEKEADVDLEKADTEGSQDSTYSTLPRLPENAVLQEHNYRNHSSTDHNEEDILPIGRRGRQESRDSHHSNDSERTLSDTDGHDHQVPPHRDRSRAQSSIRSVRREPIKVPRAQRRGLLARFTIIAEVTNPYDYSRKSKWLITLIVAIAGAAAPMASSIVLPALVDIARDFNTSATVINLSVALYMLAMGIAPLWWSSFSETAGRRTIYLTSFTLYVLFSVLGAVSTNAGMFLAMRMLNGAAGASVQAVGAGTIADVWEVKERGRAIGWFYIGPLCGPLLAPIIGGVLNQALGWRSVQWFLTIFGSCILIFLVLCLPETLRQRKNIVPPAPEENIIVTDGKTEDANADKRPTLSRTVTMQSVQVKSKRYLVILKRCFVDPLRILLYLQFPAVAICVFYATTTFMALYVLNLSVQQTFSAKPYNYPSIIVGLLYIPNSVGYILTSIFGGRWVDNIMAREAQKRPRDENGRLQYRPEDRMKENIWIGAFMFPSALIMYGWTANFGVQLAAPLVANFFFGVGSMLIFAGITTMLTEFMPRKASNGVALNNFIRNMFSCIGAALTDPLINAIGNGWLFTILGIISLASGIFSIWAMKRYGARWRVVMDRKIGDLQEG